MRSPLVVLGILVGLASVSPAAEPLSEAEYREAAATWSEDWAPKEPKFSRREPDCIAAYQTGEPVRDAVKSTTPPERFARYHTLLLAYLESSLALQDECLLQPRGGPAYNERATDARKARQELQQANREGKLRLPNHW